MFCPECGIEDVQSNQYCRGCGMERRRVKLAIERPDLITHSASSARAEIGRAIAAKVRETRSASDLATVAERVLPEIEAFLESPAERKLRRLRAGTIVSFIGLGVAVGISAASLFMSDQDILFLAALGVVTLFVGLALIVNAMFLTVPKGLDDGGTERMPSPYELAGVLEMKIEAGDVPSVTERTTRHLKTK